MSPLLAKCLNLLSPLINYICFYLKKRNSNYFLSKALATDVDLLLKDKEVSHDRVFLCDKLGEGQFGFVYKGLLRGISPNNKKLICAVKMPKGDGKYLLVWKYS